MKFEVYFEHLRQWLEIYVYSPKPGEFTAIFTDISQRKQAERALEISRQEQARLASFPELNPNPILEIDLSGSIHYINPHCRNLFPDLKEKGTAHPFLAGWKEIVEQLRNDPLVHLVREIQAAGHYYQQSIYYFEEFQLIRIYGMDISTRVQAEQALLESERQQR